jgi:hypothetical protein
MTEESSKEPDKRLMRKMVPFRVTDAEQEALIDLAAKIDLDKSNIIRRGIRKIAEENGIKLSDDLFQEKSGGNWLPKESRLKTEINQAA